MMTKHALHDKSVQAPQVGLKDPSEKKINLFKCDSKLFSKLDSGSFCCCFFSFFSFHVASTFNHTSEVKMRIVDRVERSKW